MKSLQQTLLTLFSVDGNIEKFNNEIAYVLLPDAIMKYTEDNQYSHFRQNPDGTEVSWVMFPSNIKKLTSQTSQLDKALASGVFPCPIGEEINIEAFYETNKHLPKAYFNSIEKHLIQDLEFDNFIKQIIDCSKKYEDIFNYNDNYLSGVEFCDFIDKIEIQGIYILAANLYQKYNITVNNEWLDKNVKTTLFKYYSEELAESICEFINIDETINEYITNHDWSHIPDFEIPPKSFGVFYGMLINKIKELFTEKEEFVNDSDVVSREPVDVMDESVDETSLDNVLEQYQSEETPKQKKKSNKKPKRLFEKIDGKDILVSKNNYNSDGNLDFLDNYEF